MNRRQRRALERQQTTAARANRPLTINYGHNGKEVLVRFSAAVRTIFLSPEVVDEVIAKLQGVKQAMLEAHAPVVTAAPTTPQLEQPESAP